MHRAQRKTEWIDVALATYLARVHGFAENRFLLSMWLSWASGVGGIAGSENFKEMPDSLDKAKLLVELAIQPMVSLWYRNWYSQKSHPHEEKEDVIKIALMNVQTFLDMRSKDNVELYLGFNREFQCVLENRETRICVYYVDMFHQRYWECITGDHIVDWTKLEFPVESHEQLLKACKEGKRHEFASPPVDTLKVWALITAGAGKVMFDEFRRLHEGKQ